MNATQYIGIDYRAPDEDGDGLHCWELVELFMRNELGLVPPAIEFKDSNKKATPVFMRELEKWQEVEIGDEQVGDLVLFNMMGVYSHCGIILDDMRMLHILAGRNSVIERYDTPQWCKRLIGFYRWQS